MGSAGSDLAMHEINCHFKDDYISHLDVYLASYSS